MGAFAEFLLGPGKRLIAALVGVLCVALNKKLGLEISEAGQGEIVGLISLFIAQSKWGEVAHAKMEAAAAAPVEVPVIVKAAPVLLLVLALGLSSCAGAKAFLVSGQTLDEAGADQGGGAVQGAGARRAGAAVRAADDAGRWGGGPAGV